MLTHVTILIKKLTFLIFILSTIRLQAQCTITQVGADINGEIDYSRSGCSLSTSADGLTLAVGAYTNSGGGINRGQVRVYKNISNTWIQQGGSINGSEDYGWFGTVVSLSGDGLTLAAGASRIDNGLVKVYKFINDTWIQLGENIIGEANADQFGTSISISANSTILAIGAPNNQEAGINRGHVRVYQYINNSWVQQGADIDGKADGDKSGKAVSISANGSIVAIGGRNLAGGASALRGQVRVFKNINGNWAQLGLDIDGEADNDRSGISISLSSDGLTIAIGAPRNSGEGINRGHVRVYKYNNVAWIQQGDDIDGKTDNEESGNSLSLSSDGLTLAIGAYANQGGGVNRGCVRIYKNISGIWIQQGNDIKGKEDNDYLSSGGALSINSNGLVLAIGSSNNNGGGITRGQTRVYEINYQTSIKTSNLSDLTTIYPNPFTEMLNIDARISSNETAQITLTDMMGKRVFNQTISNSKTPLNLKYLDAGVYNVIIQIRDNIKTMKVIKL